MSRSHYFNPIICVSICIHSRSVVEIELRSSKVFNSSFSLKKLKMVNAIVCWPYLGWKNGNDEKTKEKGALMNSKILLWAFCSPILSACVFEWCDLKLDKFLDLELCNCESYLFTLIFLGFFALRNMQAILTHENLKFFFFLFFNR